ncbi:MAG: hypothetical protein ACI9KE_003433 [Polyangiales bacterium]|jgi:hypothetical protein
MNSDNTFDGIFGEDEVREVLRETFYSEAPKALVESKPKKKARSRKNKKPDHYNVICISLYKEDLARLDAKVAKLKESGHRKMNRSALIRFALDTADLNALPRSY